MKKVRWVVDEEVGKKKSQVWVRVGEDGACDRPLAEHRNLMKTRNASTVSLCSVCRSRVQMTLLPRTSPRPQCDRRLSLKYSIVKMLKSGGRAHADWLSKQAEQQIEAVEAC